MYSNNDQVVESKEHQWTNIENYNSILKTDMFKSLMCCEVLTFLKNNKNMDTSQSYNLNFLQWEQERILWIGFCKRQSDTSLFDFFQGMSKDTFIKILQFLRCPHVISFKDCAHITKTDIQSII